MCEFVEGRLDHASPINNHGIGLDAGVPQFRGEFTKMRLVKDLNLARNSTGPQPES
jgi:hypothetical protein